MFLFKYEKFIHDFVGFDGWKEFEDNNMLPKKGAPFRQAFVIL